MENFRITVLLSYMTLSKQDPRALQKPMSPNLSGALQNQYLKSASYTLPDGTIRDPRQQVTKLV